MSPDTSAGPLLRHRALRLRIVRFAMSSILRSPSECDVRVDMLLEPSPGPEPVLPLQMATRCTISRSGFQEILPGLVAFMSSTMIISHPVILPESKCRWSELGNSLSLLRVSGDAVEARRGREDMSRWKIGGQAVVARTKRLRGIVRCWPGARRGREVTLRCSVTVVGGGGSVALPRMQAESLNLKASGGCGPCSSCISLRTVHPSPSVDRYGAR